MLFVAEYELGWEALEAAVAKRLEWDEVKPDGFELVGEYIWPDSDPPFRGIAVIETDSVEAINSFVLHYGPALRVRVFPATDVTSGIRMMRPTRGPGRRASRPKRRS